MTYVTLYLPTITYVYLQSPTFWHTSSPWRIGSNMSHNTTEQPYADVKEKNLKYKKKETLNEGEKRPWKDVKDDVQDNYNDFT